MPSEKNGYFNEKAEISSNPRIHSICKTRIDDMLSKRFGKQTSVSSIETHAPEKDRHILHDIICAVFADSKRRSTLTLLPDSVSRIRE